MAKSRASQIKIRLSSVILPVFVIVLTARMGSLVTSACNALFNLQWWQAGLALLVVYKVIQWLVWLTSTESVKGKVAVITGGGSGLGRLMALNLAKQDAVVVLVDINRKGLVDVVNEIAAFNGLAYAHLCDVTDRDAVYSLAEQISATVGPVDIVINNAGVVSGKSLLEVSDAMAELTFDVNAVAHFWFVKAFLPSMLVRNSGHIVSIASAAGLAGVVGLSDYCASKFAAIGLMEALRLELARQNSEVKTTTVMPFYINTGMFDGASGIPFILPILDAQETADRIVLAIQRGEKMLYLPPILGFVSLLRGIMPIGLFDYLSTLLGISASMDQFKGRGQDWHEGADNSVSITDESDDEF
ncbi:uncharacterized protein AMSG_11914 [Thecamonas trahens ATCC 50062]|uniref:Short-chain dehydrogenase/reductase 3 n=1 Tax=Thecamonas trahens ATCC 50062 TaxID=461836 RepID=A0A0L0DDD5_THETB|nr:hypothetical protein AMSG_11914 [Thecamonas trahens ATCC 50062]KNC50096.1 hypothetical protein AMSG_11914 [Thecamonas trahens ATCC 50062]|eukprot:XP_013757307.1 hypothetical protein AMSG_11914 [Thecamonas trahens ATCC 50062]